MTADDFRMLLEKESDQTLLGGPCLRGADVPFVFDPKPAAWDKFRAELATRLSVDPADIAIVGSGRLGFSLKPANNFRAFLDTSDVDVVIVSATLFDRLWQALLEGLYPRSPTTEKLGKWFKTRRSEVYTGFLTPEEVSVDHRIFGESVRPILDFRMQWFETFKQVARHVPRPHEGVTSRLYRSWRHAEMYHADGLRALRESL